MRVKFMFRAVVSILGAVLILSLMFSDRGITLAERPAVAHMGAVHVPTDFSMAEVIDDYGVHLVRPPVNLELVFPGMRPFFSGGEDGKNSDPMAGRVIREFGFFGMPFGWATDDEVQEGGSGNVIFVENRHEIIYAQLNRIGLAQMNKVNGGDVYAGRTFPFWAHMWGWLWLAGVGLAVWLWLQVQAEKRGEEGLI